MVAEGQVATHHDGDEDYLDQVTTAVTPSIEALAQFRSQLREDIVAEHPQSLSAWEFLQRTSLVKGDSLTRAGVLMVGERPAQVMPSAVIECCEYHGTDRVAASSKISIFGTLPSQIVQANKYIADRVQRGEAATTAGPYAQPVFIYPMIAVREIIANAVAHRDYAARSSCIHIRLFQDRIEVANPGTWTGREIGSILPARIDDLAGESSRRNFRLASMLTWIRLVEGEGKGILAVAADCRNVGAPVPTVRESDGTITVTIFPRFRDSGEPQSAAVEATAAPRQLPRPTDIVGRDDVMAEVSWLLSGESGLAPPVVVICGPGGIGKTALALRASHELADRYPDGQLYVNLRGTASGATDTSEILAQFLRAFGVSRVPETKAERLSMYRTLLAVRRVLVVLDDAVGGEQVGELVPANPACAVLVTARQRLPELGGVHHVAPLEPLGLADATELFLRVTREAGISVDDDMDAVGGLVELCGGLPLALRIAAAVRVHDHPRPTADLLDRLARQGTDTLAYGTMSVGRSIGAGFERLDVPGRQLFLALGLLRLTRFGLWTAEALLEDTAADAAAALSQLAASFMIESMDSGRGYGFHDLTREYARSRAAVEYPGDRDEVPAKAYRALLTLARRAHFGLYGGDFEVIHSAVSDWNAPPEVIAEIDNDPLGWFEKERSNIRAAVEHSAALGMTEICWDLAMSAHEFYQIRGYFGDWYATHTIALDACRKAGDKRGEGIVLACLNQPALVASRWPSGVKDVAELQRSVALMNECGDRHGQAIALRTLANALRRQGHLTRPLTLFNEALVHYTASADTVGQWQIMRFIGQTHLDLGNYNDAWRVLKAAETAAKELGGGRLIAQTRYWLGQACLAVGDTGAARIAFEAVLGVYRDDDGIGHAYAIHGLGDLARITGAYPAAEKYLSRAAELAHDSADALLEGRVWLSIGALHRARGQSDEQAAALAQAVKVLAGCGAARLETRALAALAQVMAGMGDTSAADADGPGWRAFITRPMYQRTIASAVARIATRCGLDFRPQRSCRCGRQP